MRTQLHSTAAPARLARGFSHLLARRTSFRAALVILAAVAFEPHPTKAAVTEAWVQHYNGPANLDDQAQAVAVDGSGNVIVTGFSVTRYFEGHPIYDYYTAKYAAVDGALLWEQRYNGPGDHSDRAQAVAVDDSGNVVVTGHSNYDYYTARYAAADGALVWEKRGPSGAAHALALDQNSHVVVTGVTYGNGYADYYTAKYAAADGALLWEKRYNGPANGNDEAQAVAVDGSGNVVVTGSSGGTNGYADYYTAKYAAANGALLWEKRYNGPADYDDQANAVAVDGSGNVVVTGSSLSGETEEFFSSSDTDFYTAKYAASDGALLWEQRYNSPPCPCSGRSPDFATAVALDSSGNVVVTGAAGWENLMGISRRFYTAKYAAADGALLWEKVPELGIEVAERARAVAVDGNGNVVVTGTYTAKYAAADGTLIWMKYPSGFSGVASSLALGPNGMIAVTGSSSGSTCIWDYATTVYRDISPVSFAAWAACSGLTRVAAAADADPDSDGLPNGVEYILGGIPTVPGTSGRPAVTTSGSNMVFTFPRDDASETPGITLTVETGTDLMTWPTVFTIGPTTAASSPGVSITENGAAPDTITVTIAPGKPTSLFARLKVTVTP